MRPSLPNAMAGALAALACAPAALAQAAPPPVVFTPHESDAPAAQILLDPTARITCGGETVAPLHAQTFAPMAAPPHQGPDAAARRGDLAFAIDAEGRTHAIRPAPGGAGGDPTAQATLAAFRFAPGLARSDCVASLRYQPVSLDEAEAPLLLRYFAVTRTNGDLRDRIARRLAGPDANCMDAPRRPRTASFPDFEKGTRPPPGGYSWTVLRWNVDAEGNARDVEILGSSGDADLDAEGLRAVSETTLYPGAPRTGCVYNFFRRGPSLPAPALPSREDYDDPLQTCPAEVGARFAARPDLTYPRAFRERGVEGWALVRFDFATWGQIGNVEVIEAEPAAVFGEEARRIVQGGRAEPGFEAGVRCVVPVRFVLPDGQTREAAGTARSD